MIIMTANPTIEWIQPGRAFTAADLARMPADGHRYELIDGALVVTPGPSQDHQGAVVNLIGQLLPLCPPSLRLLVAPFDVVLAEDTVLQPDVLVAERENLTQRNLVGPPVVAVEVGSRATRHLDLAYKRSRYEAAGCPSYWVIDPTSPSVVVWELSDGEYVEVGRASGPAELHLTRPFPVTLVPADLTR